MTAGDPSNAADPRVLTAALQAAMAPAAMDGAYRAVLSEVHSVIPFAFGVVIRIRDGSAEVIGAYPAGMAGADVGVSWRPLDAAERLIAATGAPSLDGNVRAEPGDSGPLSRLPSFGMSSVLRIPLFYDDAIVGAVMLYTHAVNAFTPVDGIALEQYVRALGNRLAAGHASTSVAAASGPASAVEAVAPAPPEPAAPAVPKAEVERVPAEATARLSVPEGSERLSMLGELVSGVAHELNNPLTTILGYAQMLPSLQGEDLLRAVSTIEQDAQRAGRIVRNLLYFAREHRPRVEPVDLNGVLQRVVEVRRYNLEANNVRIETHFGDIPELLGDQYQLEQVFQNLVTNAQQALQSVGGTVTIESTAVGDVARVVVTDTGPGVPEELEQRIFEPFFTTHEVGEGTGLGLSIAFGIVQTHGGRLLTQRAPGGGAQFIVELPLLPQAAAPAAVARAPEVVRGAGERVLVVEEEAAMRSLVSTILSMSGYAVRTADTGRAALAALEEAPFDIVISDVRMPDLDADGLYEQVRQRWPHLAHRLLFIRGNTEADRFAARLHEQDVRYLEKTFTTGDLLAAVRGVLNGARL
jgi:signal transduction histidine kinase